MHRLPMRLPMRALIRNVSLVKVLIITVGHTAFTMWHAGLELFFRNLLDIRKFLDDNLVDSGSVHICHLE